MPDETKTDAPSAKPSPIEALKALQPIAAKACADAHAAAIAAEKATSASPPGSPYFAAQQAAHHLRDAHAAFGRAEGGINQALQALEQAAIHNERASEARKKVTS